MDTNEKYAQIFFVNKYVFFMRPLILFAWFMLFGSFATKTEEFDTETKNIHCCTYYLRENILFAIALILFWKDC